MRSPESYLELLKLDIEKHPVIAVVGGGGKTSLIFRLCDELTSMGKRVVISTTTHMAYEPFRPFAPDGDMRDAEYALEHKGYVIAGHREENGKISRLSAESLQNLRNLCDVMLIEADGAKHKPIKVPEEWEPVIPDFADIVISVVGLDCLGQPICQTAHRMERTAEFLRKSMDAPVTPEDVVKIASSICGLFKNVEDRVYRVYLNKADTLKETDAAEEILEGLKQKNIVASYGSMGEMA
ncbi:MAG: selenium cofactor biosynthesis protein YqeC [Eubacteriales bacterium]|nr:selenium cofactor biosynthesis protein YqeC [Eubacteriales bacterium]